MAKVGLEFGDKLQIVDKKYRIVSEALDLEAILGNLKFGKIERQDIIYEDDTSQARNADGTYPQIPTGEIRGIEVSVKSSAQGQTVFVTIIDMLQSDIEALGLQYRDEVELSDVVVAYSSINGNDNYKIFASKIAKKGGGQPQVTAKPNENKEKQDHKG
ncbi:hypothetical protein HMPREF9182_0583 [Streptococcus sp. oral taxon 056 str. F0418]|uniref:hypothetical protein n=1 Tax=Streptococcus sp. oral taxon 056 TaxID=712620 RepID=UPI00021806F5|nr:hypothetical protein [Streptococcus sp. oral taxon 056]EGP66894.1 hypothetical protein HMPREF9182_0583 [Streptococcus sp. oral taxon 056 str. F0418]